MKGLKGRFARLFIVGTLAVTALAVDVESLMAYGEDDCTAEELDWINLDMINPELVEALDLTQEADVFEIAAAADVKETVEAAEETEAAEAEEPQAAETDAVVSEEEIADQEMQEAETEEELRVATGEFTEVNRAYREMEMALEGTVVVNPSAKEPVIVYTETSTESEKAGTMRAGDGASIIDETENWYQVVSGETEGYVLKSKVMTGEKAAIAVTDELGEKAVIDAEIMNIRLEKDTKSDILDVAREGDSFQVVASGSKWTTIRYTDGETIGYVATEFIHVEPAIGTALSAEEEAAIKAAEEEAARRAAEEEEARRQAEAARIAAEQEAARIAAEAQAKCDRVAASAGLPAGSLQCLGNFRITYYCACTECCSGGFSRTSSGTTPTAGRTISVNPAQIPYGTHVVIDGHEYVAEDSGVGSNQIDVFVGSHEQAIELGMYYTEVYVRR